MARFTEEAKQENKELKAEIKEMKKPENKKQIKELKKQGKYEEIREKFGFNAYVRNVSRKYRKEDLKKLKKEGKYEDIYNKYGYNEYEKVLEKSEYLEIKNEKGFLKAAAWRAKEKIKKGLAGAGKYAAVMAATFFGLVGTLVKIDIDNNAESQKDRIADYNKKIENYAEEVKSKKLNDVQTIMEVMDNMWDTIKGYDYPTEEYLGFWELNLATEDGFGVCRNMAPDVAKKLEKLGYNTRTLTVYMEDGRFKPADLHFKDLRVKNPVTRDENTEPPESEFDPIKYFAGNHMVTLIDIPEDNIILVADPTNGMLGIYKDGEITMFNSAKENGVKIYPRKTNEAFLITGGIEGPIEVLADYIKSYEEPKLSYEELEKKYGVEAQNRALNQVRALKAVEPVFEEVAVENNKEESFDDKYRLSSEIVNKTVQTGVNSIQKDEVKKEEKIKERE